jgi:hypothetical protein
MIATADLIKGNTVRDMMAGFGIPEEALAEFDNMTALSFVAEGFFFMYFQLFLMIMYIMLVNRYIVKPAVTTELSCYLSLPVSRKKYVATTALSLGITVLLCGIVSFLTGVAAFVIRKDADINYYNYLNLVTTSTLSALAIAYISFACGFIFSGTKYKSWATAAPILLLFLTMFYSMADWLNWLRWVSPFGWTDYSALAEGKLSLWWLIDLGYAAICGVSVYLAGYFFKKRNLSI